MQNILPFLIGLNLPTNSLKQATTSCKNVETLKRKHDLSCFKSLLVTSLWDIILTFLFPSIQSCSSKFWAWSCIASNFDKGWRWGGGGGGEVTRTRSWTGHLCQDTVQCLKYFSNWLYRWPNLGRYFPTSIQWKSILLMSTEKKKRGNRKAMFLPKRKPDMKVDVIFAVKQTI